MTEPGSAHRLELTRLRTRLAEMPRVLAAVADGTAWPPEDSRLAAWLVTTGPLNTVFLLGEPGGHDAGHGMAPLAERSSTLLDVIAPYEMPPTGNSLHELRIYRIARGAGDTFCKLMADVLPIRQHFSPNVGVWRARADEDRIFHVWAYADHVERRSVRVEVDACPEWQRYVEAITPLIESMDSMFLSPLEIPTHKSRKPRLC